VDGRPDGYYTAQPVADMAGGIQKLKDQNGNVVAQKLLIWLRTNKPGNVTADVTGIKMQTALTADPVNADNKVTIAFDWKADGTGLNAPAYDDGKFEDISIATIEEDDVDKAIPVYIYIYLEGLNVSNKDVEDEFKVVIESIKFENDGISSANAYTPTAAPATP